MQEPEKKEKNLTNQLEEFVQNYEAKICRKQNELDVAIDEINSLKEWQQKLQDVEKKYHVINKKDQDITMLKMKEK